MLRAWWRPRAAIALTVLVAGGTTVAFAQEHGHHGEHAPGHAHAPKGIPAPDSHAPVGAPPHWIPSDAWVLDHWLPYDERRLLRLLGVGRTGLWAHLRDDRRTLAELARRRGFTVDRLARALVAPRGGSAALVARARRTLTQGHMAQHVLFHTLHQETLPQRAQALFGVSATTFRELRRRDLAPLEIAALAGRSRVGVRRRAERALRAAGRRGVGRGAMSRAQGRLLLARQLRQLPRWLENRRYNGPPPTDERGRLLEPLRPHALLPTLSADGRWVAFDQSQPDIKRAVAEGELATVVRGTGVGGAPGVPARPLPAGGPCSAYSASMAGDGRHVVVETSAGNGTFAKRFGQLQLVRVDLRTGRVRVVRPTGRAALTAYTPSVSHAGDIVAFQTVGDRAGLRRGVPFARVMVSDLRRGRTTTVPGEAHEPAVSGDGRMVAFERVVGGRSVVVVRGVRGGRARRLDGGSEAWGAALSHSGRVVAYTVRTRRGLRIAVASPRTGRVRVLGAGGLGDAHDPALSPDGAHVAFSLAAPHDHAHGEGHGPTGRPRQRIVLTDLRTGRSRIVSRTASGAQAGGYSAHAAVARGGHVVAFTSDAADLAGARDGVQRVFVRDVRGGATRQVSGPAGRDGAVAAPCAQRPPVW